MMTQKKPKKPWPTKDAMQQVYAKELWGTGDSPFYSGEGSHLSVITKPYIEAVSSFLLSFENPLVVCDLGCGDFNVGKEIVGFSKHYIAVDIVPELIVFNREIYKSEGLSFQSLDIAQDKLPQADCALVRQVLQHLSNKEIQNTLDTLYQYTFVIITEHIPNGVFLPNVDIISGQGTRIKKGSGVDVEASPFNFDVIHKRELCSVDLGGSLGTIRTTLFKLK